MSNERVSEALQILDTAPTLSILSLSEPILSSSSEQQQQQKTNNTENGYGSEHLTPASLEADLAHYKDLFSKLRFSYVEQVTKERFLKAIVADPPELVDAAQNAELERELVAAKAVLKGKKVAMEGMVRELEDLGRRLAQSHEIITLQTTQLATLPAEIAGLEAHIHTLRAAQAPASPDPEQNLSLAATNALLSERDTALADLDLQIAELQAALPRRKREVARLGAELGPLEARKRAVIEEAREAKRKRGLTGRRAEELEERGRWLKGVEEGLRVMLEI